MEEMKKRTIIKVRKRKNEGDKRKDGRGRMEGSERRTIIKRHKMDGILYRRNRLKKKTKPK